MSTLDVAVIDYGAGNLLSVSRALEQCGARVTITSSPQNILTASRVVLPGVGSFSYGMQALCQQGLDDTVREVAARGTSLLGICLGMQMLLDKSDEFNTTAGLGLIPGQVIAIPALAPTTRIPHIGWNSLMLPEGRTHWEGTILNDINPDEDVYFVHSFMACPAETSAKIADCLYEGVSITSVIGRENITGCQFHPEKSGEVGLKILRRFLMQ
ncbi:MAG: imidazole glycerol phosphate synthase subunit HisH [Legionella sp.]|nr:imidazole glycerol phosphate synthase subunit HisH [Legionella sp.]